MRNETTIKLPRGIDFTEQHRADRLLEKVWRARVYLRERRREPRADFTYPVPMFHQTQAD